VKILIADDDFEARQLIHSILSAYGSCDIVINGIEALKALELAWEEREPYNLICLDILMPEMDGLEVIKEIRRFEEKSKNNGSLAIKIVVISVIGDILSIKLSLKNQCEAILPKPIEELKLIETLKNLQLNEFK
jgi:two-component system, chemotaxis family, chemotaxis protein CheY